MSDESEFRMASSRPYLVRALYEWIIDNDLTPHVVVDATHENVEVPNDFVRGGQIILNISPSAVRDLLINNQTLSFNARFGGRPMDVLAPIASIMGIYAKENGKGMIFEIEESEEFEPEPSPVPPNGNDNVRPFKGKKSAPNLRIVK